MARTARERIARILRDGVTVASSVRTSVSSDSLRVTVEGFHRGGGTGQQDRVPAQIGETRGRRLVALAEPVRFGDGSSRAGTAWEIPMRLVRAEWEHDALHEVFAAVKDELGLPADCDLSVEPRSLIICEKGQFMPPVREPGPSGDVIGGLTVTLPSTCYGGGDLLINGAKPDHVADASRWGGSSTYVTAYRGGCAKEVTLVKSGYRILLDFSLHLSGQTARPAGDAGIISETAALLRQHFASLPGLSRDDLENGYWVSEEYETFPPRLVYLLDGSYPAENLDWHSLSARDAHQVALLTAAADRAGCELVLARADISVAHDVTGHDPWDNSGRRVVTYGNREYKLGDQLHQRTALTQWTERDGRSVRDASLLAAGTEICAPVTDRDREPDHWYVEPCADCDGWVLAREYRRAAVIVWTRDQGFANRAAASPAWALDQIRSLADSGHASSAQALAEALLPSWARDIGQAPLGRPAPDDITRMLDQAQQFHGLFGQTLRTAAGVSDPDAARALLEPFQIEDLTPADGPALETLIGSYGAHWTADRIRDWCSGERTFAYLGGRPQWITDQLRDTCVRLHAGDDRAAGVARLLLRLSWHSLLEHIETSRSGLARFGQPVAAVLITAALTDATEIHDQVRGYLLRQPPEIATALEMPVLRALTGDGHDDGPGYDHVGFGVLAADCAARLRARLALTADVPGDRSPDDGGLTDRERRSRALDAADLKWLTSGWRLAA